MDLEKACVLEWTNLSFTTHNKRETKHLLENVNGSVRSGELMAVMGPSGAGKSTFLDILAGCKKAPSTSSILFNGNNKFSMRTVSAFVEQQDSLLGALTVRETFSFSTRLYLGIVKETPQMSSEVDEMLADLGLQNVQNNRIGNVIMRGISGGQARRVSLGAAAINLPAVLFVDECTSGLDSTAAFKVIQGLREMAQRHGIAVISTIHQPNYDTLQLFDKLMVLANGKVVYNDTVQRIGSILRSFGFPVPDHVNPSDHLINLVNADFESNDIVVKARIDTFAAATTGNTTQSLNPKEYAFVEVSRQHNHLLQRLVLLSYRTALNYSRNLLAYGVRIAMYLAMGVMLAVIWPQIPLNQGHIQDVLSVQFYAVAFLSFMSVAGIPSFLEERQAFLHEYRNGLYGPGAFIVSNALVNIPFLALGVVLFAIVGYWSMGLYPSAGAFFRYMVYVFLTIYTAEAQSALVAAAIPIFVAALAVASFLNGFWMSVGGYFNRNLPAFWQKSFHYMDYQTYGFQLLVQNELQHRSYLCDVTSSNQCYCSYPSSLQASGQCAVAGEDVLASLGFAHINSGHWIGILISIAVIYRVLLYLLLRFRH